MQPYIYNKTIQAKFSTNCRLRFLEVGLNLPGINFFLDFPKTEYFSPKTIGVVLRLAFSIEAKDRYFPFTPR